MKVCKVNMTKEWEKKMYSIYNIQCSRIKIKTIKKGF